MKKILAFLLSMMMLLSILPGAALGETGGIQPKKPNVDNAYDMIRDFANVEVLPLPEGDKSVEKIIPKRCMIVHHNQLVTIPIIISPATIESLRDLGILWDENELDPYNATYKVIGKRVTVYLTFRAIGTPTDTTRVSYISLKKSSRTSRSYVTIIPTRVTGVIVDPATANLRVTQTLQLDAWVLPKGATNRAVRWSSGNKSVATVSSTGLVTAVSEGTATIWVTTVDGKKKAKCVITVRREMA